MKTWRDKTIQEAALTEASDDAICTVCDHSVHCGCVDDDRAYKMDTCRLYAIHARLRQYEALGLTPDQVDGTIREVDTLRDNAVRMGKEHTKALTKIKELQRASTRLNDFEHSQHAAAIQRTTELEHQLERERAMSKQPQPSQWIISGKEGRSMDARCAACGYTRQTYGWQRSRLMDEMGGVRYCPQCGAPMPSVAYVGINLAGGDAKKELDHGQK